jgi:hypothetical protein
MSTTFTLTGTTSTLSSKYYPPIVLDNNNYVLGLIYLATYNSFPNINSSNNKFYFTSSLGKKAYITLPEGSYEIDDINSYINKELQIYTNSEFQKIAYLSKNKKRKRIEHIIPVLNIQGNNNTLKTEIKCTLDIDFTQENSIGSLLGFEPKLLQANIRHVSDFPAKILNLNTLCVECNIVSGSYRNGKQVHVIHEFFPVVPPGYSIVEKPSEVIYLPINTKEINEIILKITDQNGNLVNFRGEVITIRLHLQKLE